MASDRDTQIERIAAALREAGVAEHHDGTEWGEAATRYAAGMLYECGLRVGREDEAYAAGRLAGYEEGLRAEPDAGSGNPAVSHDALSTTERANGGGGVPRSPEGALRAALDEAERTIRGLVRHSLGCGHTECAVTLARDLLAASPTVSAERTADT